MTDVTGTAAFLSAASGLVDRLAIKGRSVFDLQYDGLSFGSWVLTAGTAKLRVRVTWDGKEGSLLAEAAAFNDSRSRPEWKSVARHAAPREPLAQVFAAAEEIILVESGAAAA